MVTDRLQTVLATTVLTGSYQATEWVQSGNSGQVAFNIDYTKGDETVVDFIVEFGAGSGGYQEMCQSITPPDIDMKPAVRHLDPADFAAGTSKIRVVIGAADAKVRLSFKKQGGAAPGSVAVTAQEAS